LAISRAAERFTVVVLSATLAEPLPGATADADSLNNRGYSM
jgi:hypothetical protein